MSGSAIGNDSPVHELPTLGVLSIWFGVLLIGLTAAGQLFVGHNTGTNFLARATLPGPSPVTFTVLTITHPRPVISAAVGATPCRNGRTGFSVFRGEASSFEISR
jgi:hypothetical protein